MERFALHDVALHDVALQNVTLKNNAFKYFYELLLEGFNVHRV